MCSMRLDCSRQAFHCFRQRLEDLNCCGFPVPLGLDKLSISTHSTVQLWELSEKCLKTKGQYPVLAERLFFFCKTPLYLFTAMVATSWCYIDRKENCCKLMIFTDVCVCVCAFNNHSITQSSVQFVSPPVPSRHPVKGNYMILAILQMQLNIHRPECHVPPSLKMRWIVVIAVIDFNNQAVRASVELCSFSAMSCAMQGLCCSFIWITNNL